jgi:hypothetical protein
LKQSVKKNSVLNLKIQKIMAENNLRNYNCKDEELSPICRNAGSGLKRDYPEFTGYSPKFDAFYLNSFEAKTAAASELVEPKSETLEKKLITRRLYANLDGLLEPIRWINGYFDMLEQPAKITAADAGLVYLRDCVYRRDVEGALKGLHTLNTTLLKYKDDLAAKGLTEELRMKFVEVVAPLTADKLRQYEITSKRRFIVQDNLAMLNDLYAQLTEILKIGKMLFREKDPVKTKEYTFTYLMSQVRKAKKAEDEETGSDTAVNQTPETEN